MIGQDELYQLIVAQFVVISQVLFERISDRLVPLCSWVQLGLVKTELAKALWQKPCFDDESALIRFDMSEYMEKFAADRLNGAPYVGYEGRVTEKVRNDHIRSLI